MKEGCLFVLFLDPLNQDALDRVLGVFGKLLMIKGGVHGLWFHDVWTCSAEVLEY